MAADGGRLQGIFTLKNIKSVPRQKWDVTSVKEIITPIDQLKTVHPEQDALSVVEQMDESGVNQMLVVSEGRVIGLVSRDELMSLVRTRSELEV
jgi:CBS domain-containing protein